MTAAVLAAAMLAIIGLVLSVRADHHRHLIARIRELRPAKPPTPLVEDAPLVAPPLHLPDIRTRYGQLSLLDAAPVEGEAIAALANDAADFEALVSSLRDPEWERRLALLGAVPPQWDTSLARLTTAWETAQRSLSEWYAAARERLGVRSA